MTYELRIIVQSAAFLAAWFLLWWGWYTLSISPDPLRTKIVVYRYPLSREQWPRYLQAFDELKVIHIGSCYYDVETAWKYDEHMAHAHSESGVICFPHLEQIWDERLMRHEVAHLLSHEHGHGDAWKQAMVKLGAPLVSYRLPHSNTWSIDYRDFSGLWSKQRRSLSEAWRQVFVGPACRLGEIIRDACHWMMGEWEIRKSRKETSKFAIKSGRSFERQWFINEYAYAIDQMMKTKATKLDLSADFYEQWGKLEEKERQ